MPSIKIIIPVYNAFEDTSECIDSVIKHGGYDELIVIDDASPNGIFTDFYLKKHDKLKIYRNEKNLGFTGTVNRGMELANDSDVILLNSDTVVTENWVQKLSEAAYSNPKIATVTPLTNNGTICSFPKFCEDNELVSGITLDNLAKIVESASKKTYPELPTCVGFCTYIKASVIKIIGNLDVETFGRGYGEENDFSRRCIKAGFTNVLDESTFIHHKGSLSFSIEKNDLIKNNYLKLCQKHPEYHLEVQKFIQKDPIKNIRNRITKKIFNQLDKNLIVHILHNGAKETIRHHFGGTEIHVSDLIDNIDTINATLVYFDKNFHLSIFYSNLVLRYKIANQLSLSEILRKLNPNLVHLHHIGDLDISELVSGLSSYPYVISLHDFSTICPLSQLYTKSNHYCNLTECAQSCGFNYNDILALRKKTSVLIKNAKRIIHFSDSTKEIFRKLIEIDEEKWIKVRHPVLDNSDKLAPEISEEFKILVLGSISGQKGINELAELVNNNKIENKRISWHILGRLQRSLENITDWGTYERKELSDKLKEIKPNIILILSQWPETYCMTVDEAWSFGIPVLVTPLGGPQERVVKYSGGYVSESSSSHSILKKLTEILNNQDEYKQKINLSRIIPLENYNSFKLFYEFIYNELCNEEKRHYYISLNSYQVDNFNTAKVELLMKIKIKLVNFLESVQLKEPVKKLIRKIRYNG